MKTRLISKRANTELNIFPLFLESVVEVDELSIIHQGLIGVLINIYEGEFLSKRVLRIESHPKRCVYVGSRSRCKYDERRGFDEQIDR